MSRRSIFTLLVVLVALVVLVTVGQRQRAPSSGTGQVFLPELKPALDDIERVTIVKAGGETVATLDRRPDSWVVTEKHDYPADVGKLRQGLLALSEARVLEQKTANPELYDRLGVRDVSSSDAAGVGISFTAAGHELPSVILGNAEGSKYHYVRRAGEAQSYLIDRNPNFPHDAAQWLDGVIIDVRSDRIRQVTITHPDGEVAQISKSAPDAANYDVADIPSGRELSYPGVANVIANSLRELRLEDVEPMMAAADEKPVTVEFRTFDGLVVRALGTDRGDAHWVSFEASVDPEQATPPQPASTTDPAAPAAAATSTDPAAEAARINAKVGGWRYRIAAFQYSQMTRHMAELLKPPAA